MMEEKSYRELLDDPSFVQECKRTWEKILDVLSRGPSGIPRRFLENRDPVDERIEKP